MLRMALTGCVLLLLPLPLNADQDKIDSIREQVEEINASVRSGDLESVRVDISEEGGPEEIARVYQAGGAIRQIVQLAPIDEGEEMIRISYWDEDGVIFVYLLRQEINSNGERVETVHRYYFENGEMVAWTDEKGVAFADDAEHLEQRGAEVLKQTRDLRARIAAAETEKDNEGSGEND